MCLLMATTEVASLVRSSRSAAVDDARLMRASWYSAGGWVGVCVCWARLLWKQACLVVLIWSRSWRWAVWKCVLKLSQVC